MVVPPRPRVWRAPSSPHSISRAISISATLTIAEFAKWIQAERSQPSRGLGYAVIAGTGAPRLKPRFWIHLGSRLTTLGMSFLWTHIYASGRLTRLARLPLSQEKVLMATVVIAV